MVAAATNKKLSAVKRGKRAFTQANHTSTKRKKLIEYRWCIHFPLLLPLWHSPTYVCVIGGCSARKQTNSTELDCANKTVLSPNILINAVFFSYLFTLLPILSPLYVSCRWAIELNAVIQRTSDYPIEAVELIPRCGSFGSLGRNRKINCGFSAGSRMEKKQKERNKINCSMNILNIYE